MAKKTDLQELLKRGCRDQTGFAVWRERWGESGYAASARLAAASGSREGSFEATSEAPQQVADTSSGVSTYSAQHHGQQAVGSGQRVEYASPMGYSPTTVNGSSGLVGMSANVLDSTSIFNTTPVSTTFHTGPQSYLDYSHEVSAYSYPTSEYAATRDLYAAPAIADHGSVTQRAPQHGPHSTTATYGPRPDYMNESSPSIEGFSGFSPHPRSTSATSLTPSHDGQASELPSAQTTIRNLELSPEPLQWNGAYGDGIIPIEEWLAILRAAASGSPDAPDTENEGKQDDLQASTDFNAAPVQGFTAAASTLLGAEPQPVPESTGQPAGLLWTDAPSAELVEWLDLPSDFDFTFGASPQGTTDDESLRAPRLSGSDEFNPWSGSGASPSSHRGPSSHDLWSNRGTGSLDHSHPVTNQDRPRAGWTYL